MKIAGKFVNDILNVNIKISLHYISYRQCFRPVWVQPDSQKKREHFDSFTNSTFKPISTQAKITHENT